MKVKDKKKAAPVDDGTSLEKAWRERVQSDPGTLAAHMALEAWDRVSVVPAASVEKKKKERIYVNRPVRAWHAVGRGAAFGGGRACTTLAAPCSWRAGRFQPTTSLAGPVVRARRSLSSWPWPPMSYSCCSRSRRRSSSSSIGAQGVCVAAHMEAGRARHRSCPRAGLHTYMLPALVHTQPELQQRQPKPTQAPQGAGHWSLEH